MDCDTQASDSQKLPKTEQMAKQMTIPDELAAMLYPDTLAVCKRLEIDLSFIKKRKGRGAFGTVLNEYDVDPAFLNTLAWALIGFELAKDLPELTGKNKRPGRQAVGRLGIDYKRYSHLRAFIKDQGEELGKDVTQADAIRRAMDAERPLFDGDDPFTYEASVSRGKNIFADELTKFNKTRAESLRRDCKNLRERRNWLDEHPELFARITILKSKPVSTRSEEEQDEMVRILAKLLSAPSSFSRKLR